MKKIRVLIVEDEPIIAADLADRLDSMGYEVAQQFSNGEEALDWLKQERPDLILMDIMLDGQLDGIQTAQQARAQYAIPIIYLSSNTEDATFQRAKSTLPAAFLTKPFRGKDLQHAIELAISRASQDQPSKDAEQDNKSLTCLFDDRIFIKVKDRMLRIFFTDILWFEADDYYCKLITKEREYLVTQTLKQMGEALASVPQFMRVHRSYIVNLSNVEEIGEVSLHINKGQIPMNKASKDEIITRLQRI
ncbi:MAG: response regulator [Lewinellaceae bacterium]|nr:response regulator [Lewinellaceae bacterium]